MRVTRANNLGNPRVPSIQYDFHDKNLLSKSKVKVRCCGLPGAARVQPLLFNIKKSYMYM